MKYEIELNNCDLALKIVNEIKCCVFSALNFVSILGIFFLKKLKKEGNRFIFEFAIDILFGLNIS